MFSMTNRRDPKIFALGEGVYTDWHEYYVNELGDTNELSYIVVLDANGIDAVVVTMYDEDHNCVDVDSWQSYDPIAKMNFELLGDSVNVSLRSLQRISALLMANADVFRSLSSLSIRRSDSTEDCSFNIIHDIVSALGCIGCRLQRLEFAVYGCSVRIGGEHGASLLQLFARRDISLKHFSFRGSVRPLGHCLETLDAVMLYLSNDLKELTVFSCNFFAFVSRSVVVKVLSSEALVNLDLDFGGFDAMSNFADAALGVSCAQTKRLCVSYAGLEWAVERTVCQLLENATVFGHIVFVKQGGTAVPFVALFELCQAAFRGCVPKIDISVHLGLLTSDQVEQLQLMTRHELEMNYNLFHFTLDKELFAVVSVFTRLNKADRYRLKSLPGNCPTMIDWLSVLSAVAEDVSCVYYLVREFNEMVMEQGATTVGAPSLAVAVRR